MPLYGFDKLPIGRYEYGVQPQLPHTGHHRIYVVNTSSGTVAQFPAENGEEAA